MRKWPRRAARLLVVLAMLLAMIVFMFMEARRMPVARSASIVLAGYPAEAPPLRIALITDTHMGGPDQSPARLDRIVDVVNAERPDLVLLGGDYIGEAKIVGRSYSREQAMAGFARLRAPLGVVAVLGNHEHWSDPAAAAAALRNLGIIVLVNQAVRRGPLVIGGVDDDFTHHSNVAATREGMAALGGAPLFLSHSPDILPALPEGALLLAGHTHCGQIALPWIGALWVPSRFGDRYRCGLHAEAGKILIVSAGIGTSTVPLRLFAPPDFWLVTVSAAPAGRE